MTKHVRLHDKDFSLFISSDKILKAVNKIAQAIDVDYEGKEPVFLCILNGSFIFSADLVREVKINGLTSFVKIASYESDKSTGKIRQLIGLNEELKGKDIIIVEDIVDSGLSVLWLKEELGKMKVSSIKIAALLFKPETCVKEAKPDYIGFNIKKEFVVGYGLDYNGLGRNLKEIYKQVNQ